MNDEKKNKKKYDEGLRWLPFDILQATTNQKHTGVTEGGWDMMRDHARTLGERDFIVLGLLSAPKHDPSINREREGTWSHQGG